MNELKDTNLPDSDSPRLPTEAYPWVDLEVREVCCVPREFMKTEALTLSYRDKVAFSDVSLPIYRGCITSLVGPSGCGKTSFLNCLNRMTDLIPGCRVEGKVMLEAHNLYERDVNVASLRKRVGMIFQKPNPFPLSIRKNLEFPLREHGMKNKKALAQAVEEALCSVGLWEEVKDRLDLPALALSGGQQQRLCIARALCLKPEVLLMDEPCSALDPLSSATIEDLIMQLKGKYTIVIVTHNLAQARRISDHTAFFWFQDGCGRLVEFASSHELFTKPSSELTAAYIGGARG